MKTYHKSNLKELILKETLELVKSKGYQYISIRKIASNLDISSTAIYRHYDNMENLFMEVIHELSEEMTIFIQKECSETESTLELLKRVTQEFIYYSMNNKNEYELLFMSPYSKKNVNIQTDSEFRLINFMRELIVKLKMEMGLLVDSQVLFTQLWSFIFGYSFLIVEEELSLDTEIIDDTLYKLLGEERKEL